MTPDANLGWLFTEVAFEDRCTGRRNGRPASERACVVQARENCVLGGQLGEVSDGHRVDAGLAEPTSERCGVHLIEKQPHRVSAVEVSVRCSSIRACISSG